MTKDFGTQVYRMQLLGFNAVRLPFSFKDFSLPGRTDYLICDPASLDDIRKSVTPPGQLLVLIVYCIVITSSCYIDTGSKE